MVGKTKVKKKAKPKPKPKKKAPAKKSVKKVVRKPAKKIVKKPAKKIVKKPAKKIVKKPAAKPVVQAVKKEIGKVSHFFSHISVAVIELTDTLRMGEEIHIKGATTDFKQKINSMQIEHQPVQEAGAGDSIGLKVKDRVREGDTVYK